MSPSPEPAEANPPDYAPKADAPANAPEAGIRKADAPALTHVNVQGKALMVDVGDKAETVREATAEGFIAMQPATLALIRENRAVKGDVLGVARVAGIMAAKRTSELIPLCHPLSLTRVEVELTLEETGIRAHATCACKGQTGVEMEALTAASVACLTIYDMCKAVDRGMEIGEVRLLKKSGGRSGTWERQG